MLLRNDVAMVPDELQHAGMCRHWRINCFTWGSWLVEGSEPGSWSIYPSALQIHATRIDPTCRMTSGMEMRLKVFTCSG